MSAQTYLPEDALVRRGIAALMAALGSAETARFLNLPRSRFPNYVKWHRLWQADLNPPEFFDEVFSPASAGEESGDHEYSIAGGSANHRPGQRTGQTQVVQPIPLAARPRKDSFIGATGQPPRFCLPNPLTSPATHRVPHAANSGQTPPYRPRHQSCRDLGSKKAPPSRTATLISPPMARPKAWPARNAGSRPRPAWFKD